MADILNNQIIIDADTPVNARRFNDFKAEFINGRNIAFRPGTGQCLIRESFDRGQTYDTLQTISGDNLGGKIETYKRFLEITCTGNAVCVLSN